MLLGNAPSPEKNIDFVSQNGDLYCILGVILYSSAARFPGKKQCLLLRAYREQTMPKHVHSCLEICVSLFCALYWLYRINH